MGGGSEPWPAVGCSRAAELEQLRQRVAWLEDWHARRTRATEEAMEVIHGLCESVVQCAELAGSHHDLQALLDSILDRLRRVERELRRSRSPLQSVSRRVADLQRELEALAAAARHTSAMAVQLRIDETLRQHRPPRSVQSQVLEVVAEALSNALRHSRGSRVALRAGVVNRRFVVSVSDDGCGFDLRAVRSSRSGGLGRMRTLAEAMKGLLQVETAAGAGTIVTLSLPLDGREHLEG